MSDQHRARPIPEAAALGGVVLVRLALGCLLVALLGQLSVDDYFRVFHAAWWWEHPSYSSSNDWLPAYVYVYGTLIGATGDLLVAPRLLSLSLLIASGMLLAFGRNDTPGARAVGTLWLLFAPLSLVLGALPLSETLAGLLLLGGICALERYRAAPRPGTLIGAAVLYLGATMVRYEMWALLPAYSAYALAYRPAGVRRGLQLALAALPWAFPAAWTLMVWALLGEPLTFLRAIAEDHFGPGSVSDVLASRTGWIIGLQAALAVVPLAVGARRLRRRLAGPGDLLWEAHLALAALVVVVALATDNIPSQLPARLFYPVVIVAAVPVGRLAAQALSARRLLVVAAVGTLLLGGVGLAYAFSLPDQVPADDRRLAEILRTAVDRSERGEGGHALIEHRLPEGAGIYVVANRPARVHIDSLGIACPPLLFGQPQLAGCPPTPWGDAVEIAAVFSNPAQEHLARKGWRRGERCGDWVVFHRGAAGAPLSEP